MASFTKLSFVNVAFTVAVTAAIADGGDVITFSEKAVIVVLLLFIDEVAVGVMAAINPSIIVSVRPSVEVVTAIAVVAVELI